MQKLCSVDLSAFFSFFFSNGKSVSDVFHTGSPDSALWEFKHGNGNFKRGDLVGLREIKRRASRHTLIHRDSFSSHKPGASQPGTPAEPVPETGDVRLMNVEHTLYDMHNRMIRFEESHSLLSSRCTALAECLVQCHQVRLNSRFLRFHRLTSWQWTLSISQFLMTMNQDRDTALYREGTSDL
jgi:hypothetical protein